MWKRAAHRASLSRRIQALRSNHNGSTLFEMLATLVPATLLAAGAIGFFSTQNQTQLQQDLAVAMEENLRASMAIVSDAIRTAGCAVPPSNLDDWIGWTSGFADDAIVTVAGTYGDRVSVAGCSPRPVASVSAFAAAGATSITVTSNFPSLTVGDLFNPGDKSLLQIGDSQHAVVKSVSGSTLTIDTDPTTMWDQGLARAFLPGTPVSRVDVSTFEIALDGSGLPGLEVDKHRGGPKERTGEGISDLRVTAIEAGRHYRVALTARSEREDPLTGQLLMRSLVSDVHLRN